MGFSLDRRPARCRTPGALVEVLLRCLLIVHIAAARLRRSADSSRRLRAVVPPSVDRTFLARAFQKNYRGDGYERESWCDAAKPIGSGQSVGATGHRRRL